MRSKSPKMYWQYISSLGKPKRHVDLDNDMFYNFFKDLNAHVNDDETVPDVNFPDVNLQHNLDVDITADEITKCINNLNCGKASGPDSVLNEYIKHSSSLFMPVYVKLFNRILSSGTLPESWLRGTIIPIYKNKGDIKQPENYRPITLLSCLGKLFTSIVNQRLTEYIESNNLLNHNQCGFRRNHSTVDNIFVLHILSEYCKTRRTKLFCAFIDFQKAFDSVWRSALWSKLIIARIY